MTGSIILAFIAGVIAGIGAVFVFVCWLLRGLPPGSWGPKR